MKTLYFGHPINVYGTVLEKQLLERIAARFPSWLIENPNQSKHDEGYKSYGDRTGRPMDYYTVEVLPHCDGGVFLAFRDGKFGAGVYLEAEFIANRGRPIWEIDVSGKILPLVLDESRKLSKEDTRARIRDAEKTPLPF